MSKRPAPDQPKPWPEWASDLVTPCGICNEPLLTGQMHLMVSRYEFGCFVHAACRAERRERSREIAR